MGDVLTFERRSYCAKRVTLQASGLEIVIAGRLLGDIDFCVQTSDGKHKTYTITCEDARNIIAGLNNVVNDVQTNCLFEHDPLLIIT